MQRMYVDQCRLKLQDCAVPKLVEKRDCFMIYEWLHWKKWRKKMKPQGLQSEEKKMKPQGLQSTFL